MNKLSASITRFIFKQSIIFESKPIFSDNTKAVYDEMVRRGYDKKYRLVWFVDSRKFAEIKNSKIIYWGSGFKRTAKEKIKSRLLEYRTKCIVCCNVFLTTKNLGQISPRKDQLIFYLSHGTPIKSVKNYYTSSSDIDYMVSASPQLNELMSNEFSIPIEHVVALGFPRNDAFSKPEKDLTLFLVIIKRLLFGILLIGNTETIQLN